MSLARQPQPERNPRSHLRLVTPDSDEAAMNEPIPLPLTIATRREGSPARGILLGLLLSIAGFWVPAAVIAWAWLGN